MAYNSHKRSHSPEHVCTIAQELHDALEATSTVIDTVAYAYPLSRPHFADKYAVHGPLQICDGVLVLTGML